MKLTKEDRDVIRRDISEGDEEWTMLRLYEALDAIDELEAELASIQSASAEAALRRAADRVALMIAHSPTCALYIDEDCNCSAADVTRAILALIPTRDSGEAAAAQANDYQRGQREMREVAAIECERHAKFCKGEADKGGDFEYLMARYNEAYYNAKRIRALPLELPAATSCIGNDPTCPCNDGDACNYKGENPFPVKAATAHSPSQDKRLRAQGGPRTGEREGRKGKNE